MWCTHSVRWLYRLDCNFEWDSGHRVPENLVFRDKKGMVRLIIKKSGIITVTRGFAWNGCSPKFCIFDILVGTPEGTVHAVTGRPKTYYASLVHDALYQFLPDGLPIRRRDADRFFLALLAVSEFAPRRIYWLAVRIIGGVIWRATRRHRKNHGELQKFSELMPPDGSSGEDRESEH